MYLSTDKYNAILVQAAHHDPESLQETLDAQRGLIEGLLTIAQLTVDDPEKRAMLDEIEDQAREIGLISSDKDANADEDECSCNYSCSSSSTSISDLTPDEIETNGEPSSGSLREYREQQATAAEDGDTENVDGTPASLAEYRQSGDPSPPKRKQLSFAELLRGGRNE